MVQFLLKPLTWLLSRFNHQWNASNSLIEAFATFILLSYVKVVNTSFDILYIYIYIMPAQIYNVIIIDNSLDCMCIIMAHWNTLGVTIYPMQC